MAAADGCRGIGAKSASLLRARTKACSGLGHGQHLAPLQRCDDLVGHDLVPAAEQVGGVLVDPFGHTGEGAGQVGEANLSVIGKLLAQESSMAPALSK